MKLADPEIWSEIQTLNTSGIIEHLQIVPCRYQNMCFNLNLAIIRTISILSINMTVLLHRKLNLFKCNSLVLF